MRFIVTAVTAAALALGLVAQAAPASAAAGYDSAYAGESAFLSLAPGESGAFTVFFVNTGSVTWTKNTSTQVDLAACLDNKVTCNAQDPADAAFRSGWISDARYATHTQTTAAPGQAATFTYSVRVPLSASEGLYRFNGALVISVTGEDIHNEGYFQQVEVIESSAIPDISGIDPEEGSIAGGDRVVISGTDFECSPLPTVTFGDEEADVLSCGEASITVTTPAADEPGAVDVQVTNANGEGSDVFEFTYVDDVAPAFESVSAAGQVVTLEFDEPICLNDDLTDPEDVRVLVNGAAADWLEGSLDGPLCEDDSFEASFTLSIDPDDATVVQGDTISVTVRSAGAEKIEDQAGNLLEGSRTETTEAAADEIAPEIVSAEATDDDSVVLTFSEPLDCDTVTGADEGDFTWDPADAGEDQQTPDDITCDAEELTLFFDAGTFANEEEGDIEYDPSGDGIQDEGENDLTDFSVEIEPLVGSGGPRIEDARVDREGFSNSADSGDTITLTFSEEMADVEGNASATIRVRDADDTVVDIVCSGAAADNDRYDADCSFDDPRTGAVEDDETVIYIQLLEGTTEDIATDESIAEGDIPGLNWSATIIDSLDFESADDADPLDLEGSDDVSINATSS